MLHKLTRVPSFCQSATKLGGQRDHSRLECLGLDATQETCAHCDKCL
jgi:hypothetical protein